MDNALSAARAVLLARSPQEKVLAAHALTALWKTNPQALPRNGDILVVPERPSRPEKPELVSPALMKRRRLGTQAGRAALLHAIAHIEFNAIDLAADMIARFGGHSFIPPEDRHDFISDWVQVCDDEARHFSLVTARLAELGTQYGDMPAHDGLWQAAHATKDDLIARLVIAPMVLEARGLDVTPPMILKLRNVKDHASADLLQIIYDDEIGHVAAGSHWFSKICDSQDLPCTKTFHHNVRRYFKGLLKPPFNKAARDLAGLPITYYEPLGQV